MDALRVWLRVTAVWPGRQGEAGVQVHAVGCVCGGVDMLV
jgi:hypothetical protein